MTKRSILFISIVGLAAFLMFLFAKEVGICSLLYESCFETFDQIAELFFVFIPLLILSLITYKMREEVFHSWLKFAYVWVPLTIILTLLAPEYDASLVSITKGVISFVMSTVFLLVSLVIIFVKYRKTR